MTPPKKWPHNQIVYRDNAAEALATASRELDTLIYLIEHGTFTREGLKMACYRISRQQKIAQLNLVQAGATITTR